MDRLISENKVLEAIDNLKANFTCYDSVTLDEVASHIKAISLEDSWVPVSKGLPKKSGNYWCTFGGTGLTGSDYYTTESDAKEIFGDAAEEYVGWKSQNVIAWMPSPKPYKM